MAPTSRIGAVTGANKGIGLAIVRNLALSYPTSPTRVGPLTIYLTARSAERGAAAVEALHADAALREAKVLARDGGDTTITFATLDISERDSVRAFRDFLAEKHPEGVDFVVNNAGVAFQGFDSKVVADTFRTNYYGALDLTRAVAPLLRANGGRMVNVSSTAGVLNKYSPAVRERFLQAAQAADVDGVSAIMKTFEEAVKDGKEKEAGFPSAAYAVSKAGMTAFTKAIAVEEAKRGRGVLVNACCPGYVKTDMTRGGGVKTPDQGAQTPVMLALADIGGKTGEFWKEERVAEW